MPMVLDNYVEKLYSYSFGSTIIEVGNKVKIGNELVVITKIIRINFDDRKMWFNGTNINF